MDFLRRPIMSSHCGICRTTGHTGQQEQRVSCRVIFGASNNCPTDIFQGLVLAGLRGWPRDVYYYRQLHWGVQDIFAALL
jgi:hypothetical protein